MDLTAQQLEAELATGLTASEAAKRLVRFGYQRIACRRQNILVEAFLEQFNDFVVLLLIAASLISALLGDAIEAIAIMAIVILNAAIGLLQEYRADQALEALKKMAAPDAFVLRDGARLKVPAREVVPGDIAFLEAGNYVPADMQLVESFNLQINEAPLTGESEPVAKRANQVIARRADRRPHQHRLQRHDGDLRPRQRHRHVHRPAHRDRR